MSEHKGMLRARGATASPVSGEDELGTTSIGEYLKRQRLLRGITVEELSATTRIPLRSLERLEAGYFDGVSDGFVRGFVRTVALALGLDADSTVARMLDEPAASQWDRNGAGLWHKQALAVSALVVVTALSLWILRAGWNLLVGGPGAASRREVVVWHDPVHRLALEQAGRIESAPLAPGTEERDAPDVDFDAQP
jgi:Helix-turn-helix domain